MAVAVFTAQIVRSHLWKWIVILLLTREWRNQQTHLTWQWAVNGALMVSVIDREEETGTVN